MDSGRYVDVQVFGTRKSADTRKALRFFSERRIRTHFVDFDERGLAPGELRRFTTKFGISVLIDRQSRRFTDLGLTHAVYADSWWEGRLLEEPLLLRLPLVRCGHELTIGIAEAEWRRWIEKR